MGVLGVKNFSVGIAMAPHQLRVIDENYFFLNQNICCGCSKEPSHRYGSFEHLKHMFKLMDKKIFAILRSKMRHIWTYVNV